MFAGPRRGARECRVQGAALVVEPREEPRQRSGGPECVLGITRSKVYRATLHRRRWNILEALGGDPRRRKGDRETKVGLA